MITVEQRQQGRAGVGQPAISASMPSPWRASSIRRNSAKRSAPISTSRKDRIERRLDAALRQTYGKRTFEAALSKDRDVMMREIRDQVRAEARESRHRDRRCPHPCAPTSGRGARRTPISGWSSERLAEAKDLRGKGEARKTRDHRRRPTASLYEKSSPRRGAQSEIMRGEGDAERNKDICRSLHAGSRNSSPSTARCRPMRRAWRRSGTTFVLKPDSEFFKYFGMDRKGVAAATHSHERAFDHGLGTGPGDRGPCLCLRSGHLKRVMAMMQTHRPKTRCSMGGAVAMRGRRRPRLAGASRARRS